MAANQQNSNRAPLDFIWNRYRSAKVDETLSEAERMKAPTLEGYMSVGESAARIICANLLLRKDEEIQTCLDFGSGHGRVARHLRVLFPKAIVYAADIRKDATDFCEKRLGCTALNLNPKFGETQLPSSIDLIFVGSVLTHIDYGRMTILWNWLWEALAYNGLLIATFHGRKPVKLVEGGRERFISPEKWNRIMEGYHSSGVGYESYDLEELGDWGVSVNDTNTILRLGAGVPDARLLSITEYGWANIQDVAVWQKTRM